MKKIDVTLIEGYEDMTPEEKIAALEAFEYEDLSGEVERYKKAVSKANSEVSELKKKHATLLSEEERAKQASEEELATLRSKVAEMEKEQLRTSYKASFVSLGYDESLAEATAKALAEGDTSTFFENQKKHITAREKAIKAEALRNTPTPPAGGGGETMTLEQFKKMSVEERHRYSVEHPEEYKQLYGGNE